LGRAWERLESFFSAGCKYSPFFFLLRAASTARTPEPRCAANPTIYSAGWPSQLRVNKYSPHPSNPQAAEKLEKLSSRIRQSEWRMRDLLLLKIKQIPRLGKNRRGAE